MLCHSVPDQCLEIKRRCISNITADTKETLKEMFVVRGLYKEWRSYDISENIVMW